MKVVSKLKTQYKLYKEWVVKWGSMPVTSWVEAAAHYREGRFKEAAELYKVGLAAHPRHRARVNALLDLSHCLFRLREFSEAERYLRQVTIISRDEREAYVRLARLQLWLGHAVEAAWTIRAALQSLSLDPELVTLFITAAVESGGLSHLVTEAQDHIAHLHCDFEAAPRLEVAKLRLNLLIGDASTARKDLIELASRDKCPFEAVVAFAQLLLDEGKVGYARHHLHRALAVSPEHPRVLRLLAVSYLETGAHFDPEYAIQLATRACQATGWTGMHEMHTLARAYAANDDKISAILIASRAKEAGRHLLGVYPETRRLEQLIDGLSSGTQF